MTCAGRAVIALAAVSFVLRLWIANLFLRTPYHEFTLHVSGPDQNRFLLWAERIRDGLWSAPREAADSPFQFSPIYPWLLSRSLAWTSHPFLGIFILQAFLSALTGWALWDCGRRLGDRAAGLAAAILWLFYAPSIFFDGCLIRESLLASTGALAFWAGLVLWQKPSALKAVAAGTALGICAAIRSHVFGPLFILMWLSAAAVKKDKKRLICGLLLVLTALAWNAPVAVRNCVVSHRFAPTATQGADAIILGNDVDGPGISHVPTENSARLLQLSRGTLSGAVTTIGRQFAARPQAALKLYRRKLHMLINDHEVTANYSFYVWRFLLPPARKLVVTWGWIFPPALLGAWLALRRCGQWKWVLVPAGVFLMGAAVVHIQARYRFVAVPFITLLAGLGISGLCRYVLDKKWGALILSALLLAGTAHAVRPDPSYGYYKVAGLDGVERLNTDPMEGSDYVTLLVSWALSGPRAHEEVIRIASNQAARSYGLAVVVQFDQSIRALTSDLSALSRSYRAKYHINAA